MAPKQKFFNLYRSNRFRYDHLNLLQRRSDVPILHVPDELYERLKKQAQANNRSVGAEVIWLLARALTGAGRDQAELLNGIRLRRSFRPLDQGAPGSTTLLRQDRER